MAADSVASVYRVQRESRASSKEGTKKNARSPDAGPVGESGGGGRVGGGGGEGGGGRSGMRERSRGLVERSEGKELNSEQGARWPRKTTGEPFCD